MERLKSRRRHTDQRPSPPTQILIKTPLAQDALVVSALRGVESLSAAFQFTLDFAITDKAAKISELPGEEACVTLVASNGDKRYIHGRITRIVRQGDALTMTLRPWPWLLSLTQDCRIYQDKSVPEIIKLLASEARLGDVEDKLVRSYAKRDYCVQYRETAFDFISRLMEESGITYAVSHQSSSHKLTLIDDPAKHDDIGSIAFLAMPDDGSWIEDHVVFEAGLAQSVTSTEHRVEDYNFETPKAAVDSAAGKTGLRVYDFPVKALKKADAEAIASDRLQASETSLERLVGASGVRDLAAGVKFTLKDHPDKALNRSWIVVDVSHDAEPGHYRNRFEAIPGDIPFRPSIKTAKPIIPGIQTAKVVGPSGKEIWTDKFGRIRVKFHWDQSQAEDETCSCWMRVAQVWAGKGFGAYVLPRIGQEVVVSFLEGDPDRPLVTGSVYNGENPVPHALAANATRTVLKTSSSPKDQAEGKGYNELYFEDKAKSELIALTAQKDLSFDVTNDRRTVIDKGHDSLELKEGNREVKLLKGNETTSIKGTRSLTVEGAETHTNKADLTYKISGNATFKVDGDMVIDAGGSITIKAGSSLDLQAGTALSLKAGTALSLQAGTELSGKAGTALSMQGATMEVKGSGMGTVDGGGMLTVKGGLVKIN